MASDTMLSGFYPRGDGIRWHRLERVAMHLHHLPGHYHEILMVKWFIGAQLLVLVSALTVGMRMVHHPPRHGSQRCWLLGLWLLTSLFVLILTVSAFHVERAPVVQDQLLTIQLAAATATWFTNSSSVPFTTNTHGEIEITDGEVARLIDVLSGRSPSSTAYLTSFPAKWPKTRTGSHTVKVLIDAAGKGYCDLGATGGLRSNRVVVVSSTHVIGESPYIGAHP